MQESLPDLNIRTVDRFRSQVELHVGPLQGSGPTDSTAPLAVSPEASETMPYVPRRVVLPLVGLSHGPNGCESLPR